MPLGLWCPTGWECVMGTCECGAELQAAGALIKAAAGLVMLEKNLYSRDIKY